MRLPAFLGAFVLGVAGASPALAAGFDPEQLAAELEARDAPEALAEASLLRLGLGDVDRAEADALALERAYGTKRPDLVARVTLARARRLAGLGEWDDLRDLLTRTLPALDRRAALDDRLEARVLLGRALVNLGKPEEAAARHRLAVALAKGGALGERGREAVGEALFRLAEVEREKAARIALAPYEGKGDRESVIRYLDGPAAQWMRRERNALELAEVAYQRVFGLDPPLPAPPAPPPPPPGPGMIGLLNSGGDPNAPTAPWTQDPIDLQHTPPPPSPRWAIAAAARMALSWGAFVSTVRGLPIPREQRAHGRAPGAGDPRWEELRATFVCGFTEPPDERLKQRAKHACETALGLALAHHIADEHTRACEAWLSKNYGAEWHVLDELRPKIASPFAAGPFAPARP
jgi:hypothetical protein